MQILSLPAQLISETQNGLLVLPLILCGKREKKEKKNNKTSVDARTDLSIEANQKP